VLPLLDVSLFQLLCLLLVLFLYLLLSSFIGVLSRYPLMIPLLLLLELLVIPVLPGSQLLLLLLVFLIQLRVASVWSTRSFVDWKVVRMDYISGSRDTGIWRSCLSGAYDTAAVEFSGSGTGRNRRPAMVH
jgi:hypothetical protein